MGLFWIRYGYRANVIDNVVVLLPYAVCRMPIARYRLRTKDCKNLSGNEIANVNFLRRYRTYVLQNTKKENLLRLTN